MSTSTTITQQFKYYMDPSPVNAVTAFQADLAAGTYGYVKFMGIIQFSTSVVIWALWESEVRS